MMKEVILLLTVLVMFIVCFFVMKDWIFHQ